MKNFIKPGDTLTLTAPYNVSSGGGMLVGSIFGVATETVLSGANVEAALDGVYDLAKTTGEAWTQGAVLYWNDTTKALTTTASTNKRVGYAAAAALSGDTIGRAYIPGVITN